MKNVQSRINTKDNRSEISFGCVTITLHIALKWKNLTFFVRHIKKTDQQTMEKWIIYILSSTWCAFCFLSIDEAKKILQGYSPFLFLPFLMDDEFFVNLFFTYLKIIPFPLIKFRTIHHDSFLFILLGFIKIDPAFTKYKILKNEIRFLTYNTRKLLKNASEML